MQRYTLTLADSAMCSLGTPERGSVVAINAHSARLWRTAGRHVLTNPDMSGQLPSRLSRMGTWVLDVCLHLPASLEHTAEIRDRSERYGYAPR
jgi:hypothetical protein